MAKKPLHRRKIVKTWDQISEDQRAEAHSIVKKTFTPIKGIVAYAPETNSEVGACFSDEGECCIKMWRSVGKDVFVHEQVISVHGAKALLTALSAAYQEYEREKAKKD